MKRLSLLIVLPLLSGAVYAEPVNPYRGIEQKVLIRLINAHHAMIGRLPENPSEGQKREFFADLNKAARKRDDWMKQHGGGEFDVAIPAMPDLGKLPLAGWSEWELAQAADAGDVEAGMELVCRVWALMPDVDVLSQYQSGEWARFEILRERLNRAVARQRPGAVFLLALLTTPWSPDLDVAGLPGYEDFAHAVMGGDGVLSRHFLFERELLEGGRTPFEVSLVKLQKRCLEGLIAAARGDGGERFAMYCLHRHIGQIERVERAQLAGLVGLCKKRADQGDLEAMDTWLECHGTVPLTDGDVGRLIRYTATLMERGYLPVYRNDHAGAWSTHVIHETTFDRTDWTEFHEKLNDALAVRNAQPQRPWGSLRHVTAQRYLEELHERFKVCRETGVGYRFSYLDFERVEWAIPDAFLERACKVLEQFGREHDPDILLTLGDCHYRGRFLERDTEGIYRSFQWRKPDKRDPARGRALWKQALELLEPWRQTWSLRRTWHDAQVRFLDDDVKEGILDEEKEKKVFNTLVSWKDDSSLLSVNGRFSLLLLLGYMYEQGIGTFVDYEKASECYKTNRVTGMSYGDGIHAMGRLYEKGKGVEKDLKEALLLYRLADWKGAWGAWEDAERLERLLEDSEAGREEEGLAD